jgi:hypothetical protein
MSSRVNPPKARIALLSGSAFAPFGFQADDFTEGRIMTKILGLALLAAGSTAALAVAGDKEWRADLIPKNGSTIQGSAEIDGKGPDSTRMEIKIKGGTAQTEYAWHLHSGACATDGPVVGDKAAYPKLMTDASGAGEIDVTLAIQTPATGDHSVHVHAPMMPMSHDSSMAKDSAMTEAHKAAVDSAKKAAKAVACGDLKESK